MEKVRNLGLLSKRKKAFEISGGAGILLRTSVEATASRETKGQNVRLKASTLVGKALGGGGQ